MALAWKIYAQSLYSNNAFIALTVDLVHVPDNLPGQHKSESERQMAPKTNLGIILESGCVMIDNNIHRHLPCIQFSIAKKR